MALLAQPLFTREKVGAGNGERELYQWYSDRLFGALRAAEGRYIEAQSREDSRRELAYRGALDDRDKRIEVRLALERAAEGKAASGGQSEPPLVPGARLRQ